MKLKESRKDLRLRTERRQEQNRTINLKKRIKSVKPEIKRPTIDERIRLQETETLCKSNIFRLQIETLLKTLKNNSNNVKRNNLMSLEKFLKSVSDVEISVSDAYKPYIENIIPQLTDKKIDSNILLKFQKPQNFQIFSLSYEPTKVTKFLAILTISKNSFREKDYLNQRYLYRKAFFLGYLKSQLETKFPNWSLDIGYYKHNPYLPFLRVCTQFEEVQIFACLDRKQFPESRFADGKVSNIRTRHILNDEGLEQCYPTPFYNSILLHDLTKGDKWKEFEEFLKELPLQVFNGLKLFLVWVKQLGINCGFGEFDFEDGLLLFKQLFHLNVINKLMSSFQIFRHIIVWIRGVENCGGFITHLDVNVGTKLRKMADRAMGLLDKADTDSFNILFTQKVEFYQNFDAVLLIRYSQKLEKNILKKLEVEVIVDYMEFKKPLVVKYLIQVLRFALGSRVVEIVPYDSGKNIMAFGLRLADAGNAFRVLDMGPEANVPEAKEFREFWGRNSQMRRFKDGTVHECVFWNAPTIGKKRAIFKQIINFVLFSNFGLTKTDFSMISNQFDAMIRNNVAENEELSMNVITTFDHLYSVLRQLKTSLEITGAQVCSSVFSYSDVYPEAAYVSQKTIMEPKDNYYIFSENAKKVPVFVGPIEIVLQYSRHSQWPNDYQAIEFIKQSLLIEIKDLLKKTNNVESLLKDDFLDIFFKGLIFRFRIFHAKSLALLKKDDSMPQSQNAQELEIKYSILPKIRSALKGIHSQNTSYGYSTALIKRWFRSQLLDNSMISDDLLEILNGQLYLINNDKKQLPQIAFLEFLKYYAHHMDYKLKPIIVNFNELLDQNQIRDIEMDFIDNRMRYPTLFIVTPFEFEVKNSQFAASLSPSVEVLEWSRKVASEALKTIEDRMFNLQFVNVKTIFTPNLVGYDLILKLNRKCIARRIKTQKDIVKDELKLQHRLMPIVDFDPVQIYLKELRKNFDKFALFFHDTFDGDTIGVLWKPRTKVVKKFKGNDFEGRKPILNDRSLNSMETNFDALVNEFVVMGGDLVKAVDLK